MQIEQRVFLCTGVAGPIMLGVSALVHMRGSKSLHVSMGKLGICSSYDSVLKMRQLFVTQRANHPAKAFAGIPAGYFINIALDILDVSLPNSVNEYGKSWNGEHLTFESLHGMKLPSSRPDRDPSYVFKFKNPVDGFSTREEFVDHCLPKADDPDLVAYTVVLLGRVWQLRDRLTSSDRKTQISLRHLLFSSLEVFPAEDSIVTFARLEDFKATDARELIRMVDDTALLMLPGQPGRCELLGVTGDFPVGWVVWREFVDRVAAGRPPKWFPMPMGAAFHDLKVGAIPTLKRLMEGAIVEDLIADGRAGLSKWYVDNWQDVGNLRKNRRVSDGVIVASILSAVPTLRAEDPEFDSELARDLAPEDGYAQEEILKSGSSLKVSKAITRQVYEDGASIRRSFLRMGSKHKNADLYLRVFLLELLIPTTGLQMLSRCGQTSIYPKFYFNVSPFIMQTTKTSYQKHSIMTMHIMSVLPDYVIADIFGGSPGAMVINRGTNPFANLPQDENLELNVGTVKGLRLRKLESLLESVN